MSQVRSRAPRGWFAPAVVLVLAIILPQRAFHQIGKGRFLWLGPAVYLASAIIAAFRLSGLASAAIDPWSLAAHPLEALSYKSLALSVAEPLAARLNVSALSLPVQLPMLVLAILVECGFLLVISATTDVAAAAFTDIRLVPSRLRNATFLIVGLMGLVALPLYANESSKAALDSAGAFALWLVVFLLVFELTIALVVMTRASTLKVLWLQVLLGLFLPVWLVGALLNLLALPLRGSRLAQRGSLLTAIILNPRAAFREIERRPPLRVAIIGQLVLGAVLVAAGRLGEFPWGASEGAGGFILTTLTLHKALLVPLLFSWLNAQEMAYLSALDSRPYLYPYAVLAATGLSVVFASAVHQTVQRLMDARGRLVHLLTCFLYIVNSGLVFAILILIYAGIDLAVRQFAPQAESAVAAGAVVGLYSALIIFVWSSVLYILAIQQVYRLPGGRALGAWFVSVILVPVSVITLFASAATELAQPFRVRTRVHQLLELRQRVLDAITSRDTAETTDHLNHLVRAYAEDSELNRRARDSVGVASAICNVFALSPEAALRHIAELAEHRDAAVVSEAAGALKEILASYPDKTIWTYRYLVGTRSASVLFGRVSQLPGVSPATELAEFFSNALVETDAKNLPTLLGHGEEVMAAWRDTPQGDELYLVYRALLDLSTTENIVDLELCQEILVRVLNVSEPVLHDVAAAFRPLLDVTQYLDYYSRADFENKVPYLAAPIMILVDEGRKLGQKPFPPEDGLLRLLVPHLQDIILREFDGLRGRADLRLDLEPKRASFEPQLTLLLTLRNQGNAVAEQVRIEIDPSSGSGFKLVNAEPVRIELLEPKREARVEFAISPDGAGRMRIPFLVSYDDLDQRGRQLPFAALLDVYESELEAPPPSGHRFINPYITGLPVKNPAMFFGREEVFHFIRENLQGQHEKNILVLRGQRRTGKTSIMYQLGNRLDEKYIPVFLDLQSFVSVGVDRFLHWVARAIASSLNARGFSVTRPERAEFREDAYGYFSQVFLPGALEAAGYHHLLLAFDEFEELAARVEDGKVDKDIFPFLRGLMQHVDRLDFLFAGTHKLQEITTEYWSILFSIALFKDIGFMSLEEVEQTLRLPVKNVIFYDDLAVAKVMRITAGHPYFVQLLGNKLVDDYLQHGRFYFTLQDVNRVLDDVLMGGALQFDYLWGQSSLIEQLLLAAMARIISREGGSATLQDITRLLDQFDVALEQVRLLSAVKALVTRELITTDSDFRRFEFRIDLVRLWLMRYQRFGVVVEAYRDLTRTVTGRQPSWRSKTLSIDARQTEHAVGEVP